MGSEMTRPRREAPSGARAASESARRLLELTAELSGGRTLEDVARLLVDHAASTTDALTAGLWLVPDGAQHVELVRAANFSEKAERHSRRLPLRGGYPLGDALVGGEPVWIASDADYARRYPASAAAVKGLAPEADLAVVCLPLVVDGSAIAGITLAFAAPHVFDEDERVHLVLFARHGAQALARVKLHEAQRRAQEEARRARAEAEEASRTKDDFLAMLGHELRNPLSPILTALHLMRLRGDGVLQRERAVIERQVHHLVRLVDDLLDVSRAVRGKVHLDPHPVELARVVSEAIEVAAPLLEERRHRLDVDVPEGLVLEADAERLAQVLSNLLTNAAKYTPPGGHVRIAGRREGGEVVVEVSDDGDGIAPALLPRVFDLFTQGRQGIDRKQGGLGLGLTIARELVVQHGGTIAASSPGEGQGATLTVRLPCLPAGAAPASQAVRATSSARAGSARRVLVVDDNADAADMLREALSMAGHEVAVAHDGPSALQLVRSFVPDVAFLDIGLPVMDGYELAAHLRQTPGLERICLVAVTGYAQADDRARARAHGFTEHLAKPVDLARALACVVAAG